MQRAKRDTLLFSEGPGSETAAGNMRFNLLVMLSFAPKRGKCYFLLYKSMIFNTFTIRSFEKITVVVFILYFFVYIHIFNIRYYHSVITISKCRHVCMRETSCQTLFNLPLPTGTHLIEANLNSITQGTQK